MISESRQSPMVHCYAFSNNKIEQAKIQSDLLERCAVAMGYPLDADTDLVELHHVRNVAPAKSMYCISFRVPKQVLFHIEREENVEGEEKAAKRAKLEI
jgi:tRNA (guanine37-N1)-methyltransferase